MRSLVAQVMPQICGLNHVRPMKSSNAEFEVVRGDFHEIRMGSPQFASLEVLGSKCALAQREFGEVVAFSASSQYLAAEELMNWSPPETRAVVFDLKNNIEFVAHIQAPGFIRDLEWLADDELKIHAWSHISGETEHVWKVARDKA